MSPHNPNATLRVLSIVEGTSVDGPGLRTAIYLAGCNHACPGCHNPQSWDFQAGTPMSAEEIMEIVRRNQAPVTFSGGDPFYSLPVLLPLLKQLKAEGYNVWCYTGFTFEQLQEMETTHSALPYIDVLVDGPFIMSLRDEHLPFRGSSNQRIIDIPATLRDGKVVLHPSAMPPEPLFD